MGYVLVLDNDQSMRELLAMILAEEGYAVQAARCVTEALALARQVHPVLILFDMLLSDGDGAEFVARYRQLPDATATLIAVSGVANLDEEAARIGADGFLTKPFDLDDLLGIVAGVLPDFLAEDASA